MRQYVIVKSTKGRGRGVYALKNFSEGEVIERCPVLNLTPKERKHCSRTLLNFYMYPWRSTRSASLVLGFGSLYNHSYEPNADWKQNFHTNKMIYTATKPIKKGEEILINYNGEPEDKTPIDWFDVK
jgi:SET domain-containing protein